MTTSKKEKKGVFFMKKGKSKKEAKTVGINMQEDMANDLEKRAKSINLSTSAYCRVILQQWLDSGKKLVLQERD